jgi:hypothetical protein
MFARLGSCARVVRIHFASLTESSWSRCRCFLVARSVPLSLQMMVRTVFRPSEVPIGTSVTLGGRHRGSREIGTNRRDTRRASGRRRAFQGSAEAMHKPTRDILKAASICIDLATFTKERQFA